MSAYVRSKPGRRLAASGLCIATPIDPSTRTATPAAAPASTMRVTSASSVVRSVWIRRLVRAVGHRAIVAERIQRCGDDRDGSPSRDVPCAAMGVDAARVVVIGGGITGCSVALHLAEAGWSDVLLVEKATLTAGSTCHAAGLVTAFNPSSTMMSFRRYSIDLYERLGVFDAVGSLRLASSEAQLRELERTASRARGIGLDVDVIGRDAARRLMPAISEESLYGAVHLPGDGHLDPHTTTHAVADAARAMGVRIRTGVRVTGFELSARPGGPPGAHGRGTHRYGTRGQRGRHLGAADRRDGRGFDPVDRRSITSTSRSRPYPGMSCRETCRVSGTLTTSSTARVRARWHGLRRVRNGSRVALGGRRALGARGAIACRPTTIGSLR